MRFAVSPSSRVLSFPGIFRTKCYGTAVLVVTGVYCVVGGMYSVVMNDLIQFGLILVAGIAVAVIAMVLVAA